MTEFLIIDDTLESAFETSKEIEASHDGEWLFFDSSKGSAHGLYKLRSKANKPLKNTHLLSNVNDSFLEHLLGLFTPELNTKLSVHHQKNFKNFCTVLNDLLNEEKKIYDLSRKDFWIWAETGNESNVSMGQKLKNFLDIT